METTSWGANGDACAKRCYTSVRVARLACRHLHRRIRVYRCEACGGHHVATEKR